MALSGLALPGRPIPSNVLAPIRPEKQRDNRSAFLAVLELRPKWVNCIQAKSRPVIEKGKVGVWPYGVVRRTEAGTDDRARAGVFLICT
jgi:hypothetical protein